ncbi:MAG: hypothetical protein QHH07_10985, partial [Sedimentisphaerales bacterium]|nr:hypothetical protein [Sedimentisphaerales bacterium]
MQRSIIICFCAIACLAGGCGKQDATTRPRPLVGAPGNLFAPDPSTNQFLAGPTLMQTRPFGQVSSPVQVRPQLPTPKHEPAQALGPTQLTAIYPSPEYGVIKVDKIIPKEVDLNVQ